MFNRTVRIEKDAGLALSADDVQQLLSDKPGARLSLTDRFASAYGEKRLSDEEYKAAEQIFRLLVRDAEIQVRVTLAQHVKSSTQIPRDIVMTMARDVAEVALPVLECSEVLSDDDLVELVHNAQEISRQVAISKRKQVSNAVSDALLDKGHEEVAKILVTNEGAQISDRGYERIIEKHATNEKLMKTVSESQRLPVAAAEKLIHVVSSSLATELKRKYKMESGIEQEVEHTRETETFKLIAQSESEEDIDALIGQLQGNNRLTPALILNALCKGNFGFFEASLGKLSNIPVSNARKLIADKGELGFRAIYNKSGLPDAMFPAVKLLLAVTHELHDEGQKPGTRRYANRVIERLLKRAEETPVDNLSYLIALVRKAG